MDSDFLGNALLVADSGSIAEAARRINRTPAAIAQQIQALERELGVKLFKRVGRSVVPTEAGHRVLEQAAQVIKGISQLKAVALADEMKGELRIGVINTALLTILPDVLASFIKQFPEVRLVIQAGLSLELYNALQREELDLVFCLQPPFALSKAYEWQTLKQEKLVVLAPVACANTDPIELLTTLPFIRYSRSLGGGKQADNYLTMMNIVPHELFELNSLVAIAVMVERNLGVALVPDINASLLDKLAIVKIALPEQADFRTFGLMWHRASVKIRLIHALKNLSLSRL